MATFIKRILTALESDYLKVFEDDGGVVVLYRGTAYRLTVTEA